MNITSEPVFAPSAAADGAKALPRSRTRDPSLDEADAISLEEAFEEFLAYRRFVRLRILAVGVPDSAVDDVLSEVGMNFAKRLQAGPVASSMAYLAKMATFASIDYLRALRRREVLVGDDWEQVVPELQERSSEDTVVESLVNEELLLKVRSLPTRQHEVIIAIYMNGMSYEAIAKTHGMAVSTVRRYHSRALETLRDLYGAVAPTGEER
ncbi:RNA polymerase sigma factor [Streptomyces uncialis]|uniref:RNA polymerase sigma factor n=1 Tax=Streptomyces uncialis TaxID=1048205 RepID=UPI003794A82F